MKTVFFGTPAIAVKALEFLANLPDVELVCVVTQPDRPSGRGHKLIAPPVKTVAQELGIDVYQPTAIRKDIDLIEKLKSLDVDFFVTFAFGQILSQEVLDIPRFGTINLHASLLPKYRGANPIQRAVVNGDKKTGITTMLTVLELDAGDICLIKEIEITDKMTTPQLQSVISEAAPELIHNTLKGLFDKVITPVAQDHAQVSFAHKFKKQDGIVVWTDSAAAIHNKIRGLRDWPCAQTFFNGKVIKLLASEVIECGQKTSPGTVLEVLKSGIVVATGENNLLIKELQPESKPKMSAFDFANGAKLKPNNVFGGDECAQGV